MDAFWDQLEPLMQKVIPTTFGRETIESLKNKIYNNDIILWIMWADINNIQGIVSTKIIEYPNKKVLWWGFLASQDNKMKGWFPSMTKTLSKYAKVNDCDYVEIVGRKGWVRELKKVGINISNIGIIYEGKLT